MVEPKARIPGTRQHYWTMNVRLFPHALLQLQTLERRRFCAPTPSSQQLSDGAEKVHQIKRLCQKGDRAFSYLLHGRFDGTDQQRGNVSEPFKGMQSVMQFQTVHIRKVVVEDQEMRSMGANRLKCLAACGVMPGVVRRFLMDELGEK